MAQDYSRPVRIAVLAKMRASPLVLAFIPAASQYSSTVPVSRTFPFTHYGAPIATPFLASGLDSSATDFTIHSFTKPLLAPDGTMLRLAEDQSHFIADAIVQALGDQTLDLGDKKARVNWLGTNQLEDPAETELWHAVIRFRAEVAG